jgi:nucleoside-diphosphate-sugar epimerase
MSTRPTVAVTGATGFLGGVLVEQLRQDHDVVVLVRPGQNDAREIERPGVRTVFGHLDDPSSLAALVRGADTVYHCAAFMGKNDAHRSWRVNVDGTERLAQISAASGVRRFVYVSSISVYSATRSRSGTVLEDRIPDHIDRLNPYARTKYAGELRVRRVGEETGMEWTVIRPTNVYGPGSRPWFHQWVSFLRRWPFAFGNIAVDIVHVDDVVQALVKAARSEAAVGRVFHVGNETVMLNRFLRALAGVIGQDVRAIPRALDAGFRWAIDRSYRIATGTRMSLSLVHPVRYPSALAGEAFGYVPEVTLEEGMKSLALSPFIHRPNRGRLLGVLLALSLVPAVTSSGAVHAQTVRDSVQVRPGAHVRIRWASGVPQEWRFVRSVPDSVLLARSCRWVNCGDVPLTEATTIALSALSQMEYRAGTLAGRGFAIGFGVGMAAAVGLAVFSPEGEFSREAMLAIGTLFFGVPSGLIGLVIGATHRVWVEVPFP